MHQNSLCFEEIYLNPLKSLRYGAFCAAELKRESPGRGGWLLATEPHQSVIRSKPLLLCCR